MRFTIDVRKLGLLAVALAPLALPACAPATAGMGAAPAAPVQMGRQQQNPNDPRVGLRPGREDAGAAAWNMELEASVGRPAGFFNPENMGDGSFNNTDIAFRDNLLFLGNYNGFNIYDISDPENPRLRTSVVCPGGQGDLSIHGNLLFMSVEQTRGRLDCGPGGVADSISAERFRGVRIFDVSDLANPKQVTTVQTCRGSHTHTLVTDPDDRENVYVYVSGTSVARPAEELAGCSPVRDPNDPNTSYWSIAVIQVPLRNPQMARVVSQPRVFANLQTGEIAGLWQGGTHGEGTQTTAQTNQCHDITAYPEIGLAAGACSGNGILLDIRDVANPRRIEEVSDPNFAYWHSATFNNDGTKVIFTDEWGGGGQPRCQASDPVAWGANAIYTLQNGELTFASHYKLPAPQSALENCVAHNGSLIPVPGRDIKVQAWYQGGASVFDFTDPANPVEIAFFDRGPISATELLTGGYWSTYWYNGYIYGSEIARGLDVLELEPSQYLSENELEAAKLVRYEEFNAQNQPKVSWPAVPVVARAYLDGLSRRGIVSQDRARQVAAAIDSNASGELTGVAAQLESDAAGSRDPATVRALAGVLRQLGSGR